MLSHIHYGGQARVSFETFTYSVTLGSGGTGSTLRS